KAAARDPAEPLALYLQGWARQRAGQTLEGEALIEQARYLSLGDAAKRATVADALTKRDLTDLARREREIVHALGWHRAWSAGNMDLALLIVPELAKRGRQADADALYERAAEPYRDLCKEHPNSAYGHNSLAWLAAVCRRDLDTALTHAQKATELVPKFAGYRDTLAEVYFQRGDKAKAIALMKESLRMEPKKVHFAKQLQRFEAGD